MKQMGWPLVVVFVVMVVVVGVLIWGHRAPAETLGTLIAAFLGWLAPSPIASPGLAPRIPASERTFWKRDEDVPPTVKPGGKS